MSSMSGTLARRLGRVDALAIGVGSVIGTGIFRTTGEVLRGAGGFVGATLVWVAVALVSAAGAIVYAALAARVPEAGGPYAYVREAFGRPAAFLDGGVNALVSIPARHAAAVGVIGELLARVAGVDRPRVLAVVALLALLALNLPGVRAGANAQRVFTVSKLVLAATVVALGVVAAGAGRPAAAEAAALPPVPFSAAAAACWYSFLGWQDTALLSEEMKNPARDMRFALVTTVAIVTTIYLAIHAALFVGLGADAGGAFPALTLARRFLGAAGETAMSIGLLVSMFGGAAETLMVRPRFLFALARDRLAPRALTFVNRGGAPAGAMLLHTAIVLGLVATGTFRSLLALVAFSQSLTGLAEAASALVLLKGPSRRAGDWLAQGVLVLASAALCTIVAWHDPWQVAYTVGVLAVLGALYPLVGAARGG
jgi:APA family basic amino acid/polyamine antiporter